MDFKRNSVIGLYLVAKSQPAVVHEFERLKVNKVFVYRTITRYNGTGSIAKRPVVSKRLQRNVKWFKM